MLAQSWLYGRKRIRSVHDDTLERYLKLPTKFNPHTSVAELNRYAERIVFTDDVPSLLYEMCDNKQLSLLGMVASARLPYDIFWIEYTSYLGLDNHKNKSSKYVMENTQFGALCMRVGEAVRMYLVMGAKYNDKPDVYTILTNIVEFPQWPPKMIKVFDGKPAYVAHVVWTHRKRGELEYSGPVVTEGDVTYKLSDEHLEHALTELIFGIFLVTQPKVYSHEHVVVSDKLRKQRERKRKPPLLEYRKLRLHIGRKATHYVQRSSLAHTVNDTDSDDAVQHRRYHKVMGHFRHYMNEKTVRTVWIEAHYRGDPKLGVTFTERDVSR